MALSVGTELAASAGRIVEEAHVEALFGEPSHPYTRGLLAAHPYLQTARLGVALPSVTESTPWAPLLAGWAAWLAVPLLIGLYRFRRVNLR